MWGMKKSIKSIMTFSKKILSFKYKYLRFEKEGAYEQLLKVIKYPH